MARILDPTPQALGLAAASLRDGRPVAFPTETVYGLGGGTFDETALRRVFELKGRPFDNPLIAHVLDAAGAARLVVGWSERCEALAERFWPGPLTLVLKKAASVPDLATAARPTIAVRCPRHEVARRLLEIFAGPISAPSANRSGHVSPTTAAHVAADFADALDLIILDGGRCEVGIESTVLDLTVWPARILRPGSTTRGDLAAVLGHIDERPLHEQGPSPGTSPAHYAPRKPARLVDPAALQAELAQLTEPAVVLCFDAEFVCPPHRAIEMPQGAADYARRLYEALRKADALPGAVIIVVRPPLANDVWLAVHDRLERATSGA